LYEVGGLSILNPAREGEREREKERDREKRVERKIDKYDREYIMIKESPHRS